jgi:hypothetical protein
VCTCADDCFAFFRQTGKSFLLGGEEVAVEELVENRWVGSCFVVVVVAVYYCLDLVGYILDRSVSSFGMLFRT